MPPSSNWIALKLPHKSHKRKRLNGSPSRSHATLPDPQPAPQQEPATSEMKNGEYLLSLRKMILGDLEYTDKQRMPGKYLALDCEMVGVGINGTESSLARVSLVNFYGAVQLDEFVRQRERVVDYRTQYSGVRESDMIKAKPFKQVQTRVAELLKDRVLVGHAVFNDLKALLLSHPRPQIRDTQHYASKFKLTTSKYIALRSLVMQEVGVAIQGGEHSSVTDARATMAVYRLHQKEWEKGGKPRESAKKRKRGDSDVGGREDGEETGAGARALPGGGKKGVSSGLSTVVRGKKRKWWKELNEHASGGSTENV